MSPAARPASRPVRRLRGWRSSLALFGIATALLSGGRASAGWDDFEFGQRLIEKGYIGQAQKVFESILKDTKRPQVDRDRARFGMALLGKADAGATASRTRPFAPYAEVKAKFDTAVASIREFVKSNSQDAKADDARSKLGELCLWYADWASRIVNGDKPEETGTPAERGAKPEEIRGDAQAAAKTADEVFVDLSNTAKKDSDKDIARFQAAVAKYVRGKTFEPCTKEAVAAFDDARRALDEYVTDRDGYLTAVYAEDKLGLTFRELGDCETDPDKKGKLYLEAMNGFAAAAQTDDQGDDYRNIIALGYRHAGEFANHFKNATDSPGRDMVKAARTLLMGMEKRVKSVLKMQDGVLALVEWAYLEMKLENGGEAINIAKRASDLAQQGGFPYAKTRADEALRKIIEQGASGTSDPGVIFKVGEDLKRGAEGLKETEPAKANPEFGKAIAAFQSAIQSAPPTREALVSFVLPGWRNIGDCYMSMKPELWLEAATAYDAILDEVRGGRIKILTEADPPSRVAYAATQAEKKALKKLGDITGDPTIGARLGELQRWEIPTFHEYGGGGISDAAYSQARQFFDAAIKAKSDADGKGESWKKGFLDSKPYFEDVSKSDKSDYQDNALAYLARVPFEVGDFAGAVAAADAALSWWKGPEAQKRLTDRLATQPDAAAKRKSQQAAATYWRASALHELKRDDEAMPIVEAYPKEFGSASGDYLGRARGLQIEILLAKGQVEQAEEALAVLLREFPEYYALPRILGWVANYYGDKVREKQARIDAVTEKMVGTPEDRAKGLVAQEKALDVEITRRRTSISDMNGAIAQADRVLADKGQKAEKDRAQADRDKLLPVLAQTQQGLKADTEKRAAIDKELDALATERTELRKQQAPPLKKVADLDRRLDEIRKSLDANDPSGRKRRRSETVSPLAGRYYRLAKLEPDVAEDWDLARSLYEDYLAFPDVKDKPDTDDGKRLAYKALGEIYDHLAVTAKSPEEARGFSANAVKYLQATIARNPANTPLLVAALSGDSIALSYEDLVSGRKWRIPVRRVDKVDEFRKYVKELTGERLPHFVKEETQKQYEGAVAAFKKEVDGMNDERVERIVKSLREGGFDPTYFSEHAITQPDFLLSLAWSYVRSGVAENLAKALNASRVVTQGPSKVENDSSDWWEAQTIQLTVFVASAEQAASADGGDSATAKSRAKSADEILTTVKRLYPRIGGADRHAETLKEWKALKERLDHVMGKIGLAPTPVDLEAEVAPEPVPATPPAPPAMDGASMDEKK